MGRASPAVLDSGPRTALQKRLEFIKTRDQLHQIKGLYKVISVTVLTIVILRGPGAHRSAIRQIEGHRISL